MKAETGREIIAAQDQALETKYHATNFTNRRRRQMETMPKI
jgi:hypothetical protein